MIFSRMALRVAVAASIGTVSQSCSMRKLFLDHADWFVMYQIDEYFDISKQQREKVKPSVVDAIRWVRVERAADINVFFEDFKKVWRKGPDAQELQNFFQRYEAFKIELFDRIAPVTANFLATLSDQQLDYLTRQLKESNEDLDELVEADPEDFNKKQRKRLIDNLDDWVDDLTDEQEAAFLSEVPPDQNGFKSYVLGRRKAHENFLSHLRARKPVSEIEAILKIWARNPHLLRGEPASEVRAQRMTQVILATHKITNEKQRLQIEDLISGFQKDLLRQ